MWRSFARRPPSPVDSALLQDDDRTRRMVMRAFQEIAGTQNGVVYNLPLELRPEPVPGSIYVRGGTAWRSYLDARERVDTGEPAILFSLRVLDDEERHLIVDWGTTYPNTFLLVEPHDPAWDLSDPSNVFTRRMKEAVESTLRAAPPEAKMEEGWTRSTPLGALMREVFGTWVYWSGPEPYGKIQQVSLNLTGPGDTLWARLLNELVERFPQPSFDRALAYVNDWERELLGGPVPRARSVFRTRLGMPILRDSRCVDRALRRLANEGRITVIGTSLPGRPVFGRGRPIPEDVSDDEFTRFMMG